jgi:hypothetical protein
MIEWIYGRGKSLHLLQANPLFLKEKDKGFNRFSLFKEKVSLIGDQLAGFHSLAGDDLFLKKDELG